MRAVASCLVAKRTTADDNAVVGDGRISRRARRVVRATANVLLTRLIAEAINAYRHAMTACQEGTTRKASQSRGATSAASAAWHNLGRFAWRDA